MTEGDWVSAIREKDPRYARGAFEFVQDALRMAHARAGREGHVTGKELLGAFRELAVEMFGPLARTVLAEWGIRATDDVGNIVFLCVEAGEMGKTDEDTAEDFRAVYDFDEVFPDQLGEVRVARPGEPDDDEDEESSEDDDDT